MTRPARYEEPAPEEFTGPATETNNANTHQLAVVSPVVETAEDVEGGVFEPDGDEEIILADDGVVVAGETEDEAYADEDDLREQEETLVSADLVRVYLRSIGKTALLNAAQEVDLAKRMDTGMFASAILSLYRANQTDDPQTVEEARQSLRGQDMEAAKKTIKDEAAREKRADRFVEWAEEHAERAAADPDYRRALMEIERDGDAAKNHLYHANLRLVVSWAKRYTGHGMKFLDLIQEGNVGLLRGVEMFDYEKGFKFSTYASWWIRQAMTRALADQERVIRIPVHRHEQHVKMDRKVRELINDDKPVTPENIAKIYGVTRERIRQIEGQTMNKLRHPARKQMLSEYSAEELE